MNETERIEREKSFHERKYSDDIRANVRKFYSITKTSRNYYLEKLLTNCERKKVLEYGCGPGTYSFELAEKGAIVTGIDISEVAIEQARNKAKERGLTKNISFMVMNAEDLKFDDGYFDIVCGVSILHHLNIKNALKEVSRVLNSTGSALFIEPLGHNPFINIYRYLTPHLRSEDEHPLIKKDLKLFKEFFDNVNISYFHLVSLFAVPFHNTKYFDKMLSMLDSIDQLLFRADFFRLQAWQIVAELSNSKNQFPI